MKKLTTIWMVIGIIVTLAAAGAAVYFWFRRKAAKAEAEELDAAEPETGAEPETAQAQPA